MQDHHQLDVWQRSMDFAVKIYVFSTQLPDDERYNLVSQLRRAVTSVPLNVAEGAGSATRGDFARFLGYAYRSLKEVETGLELCERLYRAVPPPPIAELVAEGDRIARMTYGLIERLNGSDA